MTFKILSAQDADKAPIESLFAECFGKEASMYKPRKIEKFKVAMVDGELVAAGAVLQNSLHGAVPRVVIGVKASYRRQKIGTDMHRELIAANSGSDLGYDGCCYDNDTQAISFMRSLGYEGYLDCFIPVVGIKAGVKKMEASAEIQFMSLAQAFSQGVSRASVVGFLKDQYCKTHDWSPVTISSDDPAWDEIALGEADLEMSFVGLCEGRIVAVSTASIDQKNVLQIIWPFAIKTSQSSELVALKAILAYQFSLAARKSVETASFELDSNVPSNTEIPACLQVLSSETWRRFRYKA